MCRFEYSHRLAKTIYGEVSLYEASEAHDAANEKLAVKRIDKAAANRLLSLGSNEFTCENGLLETKIYKMLQRKGKHANILHLRKCIQDQTSIYLVFDYIEKGDLFELRKQSPVIDILRIQSLFSQIVNGVAYLHANGYAHRDLSLENVLVNENDQCWIFDFGLVARLQDKCKDCVGKVHYMAPELFAQTSYYPGPADIWSLGMILFILAAGFLPFNKATLSDDRYRVFSEIGLKKFLQKRQVQIASEVVELLSGLLQVNPSDRMTISQLHLHPWILRYEEVHPHFLSKAVNAVKHFFHPSDKNLDILTL